MRQNLKMSVLQSRIVSLKVFMGGKKLHSLQLKVVKIFQDFFLKKQNPGTLVS